MSINRLNYDIRLDPLTDPVTTSRVAAFLQEHIDDMHSNSPPESVHALNLDALRNPSIQFWALWLDGEQVVATGALKRLDEHHAELKSMRSAVHMRGQGLGRAVLLHILAAAKQQGFKRISLETGTGESFAPAHGLYRRHGFVDCEPFADYRLDPYSHFMTLLL